MVEHTHKNNSGLSHPVIFQQNNTPSPAIHIHIPLPIVRMPNGSIEESEVGIRNCQDIARSNCMKVHCPDNYL